MSNMSKCFSCVHKNDYDPKFGYYGCNLSGQECKGYSMFEPKAKPKPTNADRIRSMSDEELAEFMALNTDCYYCRAKDNDRCASLATTPCGDIWLDWLKQEADDDKSGQDQRDDG